MSHKTEVKVQVDHVASIKKSLEEMGYQIKEGKHVLKAFDWKIDADFSLMKDGRQLNVGFVEQEDGTVACEADWWGTGINQNKFQQQLQQLHSKHKVIHTVRQKGWNVDESQVTVGQDGAIGFSATRWSR